MTFIVNDFRYRKQFGTDCQTSSLDRIQVDCEAQSVIFQNELDPSAALRKILAFPDYERAGPLQICQYFWQTLFFFLANENKFTCFQIGKLADPAGQELATIDVLALDKLIERAAKWVVPKYANSNWRFFTLKSVCRPFDEFCKVK